MAGSYSFEANLNPLGTIPYPDQLKAKVIVQVKDVDGARIPWADSIIDLGRGGLSEFPHDLLPTCFDLTNEKVAIKEINSSQNSYFHIANEADLKNAKIKYAGVVDSNNLFWKNFGSPPEIEIIIQMDRLLNTYSLVGKPITVQYSTSHIGSLSSTPLMSSHGMTFDLNALDKEFGRFSP